MLSTYTCLIIRTNLTLVICIALPLFVQRQEGKVWSTDYHARNRASKAVATAKTAKKHARLHKAGNKEQPLLDKSTMMQNGGTAPSMGGPTSPNTSASPIPPQWYEQQKSNGGEIRSVTPAMNNTRGVVRNPQAPYPSRIPSPAPNSSVTGNQNTTGAGPNTNRATTPNRYYGAYNVQDKTPNQVSSTGLIRLTLRKPMGIVFEPMYDPNQASVQRGVRICDLPRTGAAALSRKLEVGDELLSINDKTMSRLTFDEIMDFIIEADPEQVNLLFRRPRKEAFAARTKPPIVNSTAAAGVKWVDDAERKKGNDDKDGKKNTKSRPKRASRRDDETVDSEFDPDRKSHAKGRGKAGLYENESFLDLLIDTICANPDSVCRSKRGDDDYYSDEDDDRTQNSQDDSTYVTYESEKTEEIPPVKSKKRRDEYSEAETEDETFTSEDEKKRKKLNKKNTRSSPIKENKPKSEKKVEKVGSPKKYYEEDATLETIETKDRPMPLPIPPAPALLGLAAKPDLREEPESAAPFTEDESKPAPISTLEYDDFDHGADVSVMESLGGPSLLIEKQRQAAKSKAAEHVVPSDIVNTFAQDYPAEFGLSREQTIQKDPLRFYTYVVKLLLEAHEPEKVRLLDKLLAKYKGREDHLVQKLSVRYNRSDEAEIAPTIPDEQVEKGFTTFAGAVNTNKESAAAAATVALAKERSPDFGAWGDCGTKEDQGEEEEEDDDSASGSGSDFSGESIDGTSPAVIAQVSELLNYVYGKTSVPGQIDRVSTIMRAYEGREAVLLELLETKALIKANSEKENAINLPSFLRNSPALQHDIDGDENPVHEEAIEQSVSPLSSPRMQNQQQTAGGNIMNDDISSMSGVSSPAPEKKIAKVSI